MDIDFSLVLVVGVALTGAVWLFDFIAIAPKRRHALTTAEAQTTELNDDVKLELSREPLLVEYSKSFFPVLALVLVLRSFLVEPFQIPSGSMLPTLKIGDFILVNKFHYGIRLPVIGTKVFELNDPQRGDVMVFKFPKDPRINYIKRVVGLPGDHIRYADKTFFINGKKVEQSFVAEFPVQSPRVELAMEQLGDVKHQMYKKLSPPRQPAEWVVPAGHYFMIGDNRDNSNDSRFWGFVPDELVVGKAFAVWMHWESWLSIPSFRNNGMIQ